MRLLFILLFFFTAGCSSLTKDNTITWSVQKLYKEAKNNLNNGSLLTSRTYYNILMTRYPFSIYAKQSSLDLIWLEYKDKKYEEAVSQADKFIRLYPTNQYIDYAKYMKAIIAYSRDVSFIDKIFPTNLAKSDMSMVKKAYDNFNNLVNKEEKNSYTEDAKKRMVFLRSILAEHEIYVAEYYISRGAFLAAANRSQYVISNYSMTKYVPIALAIMIRSYNEMDMPKLATDTKMVLDKNFPNAIKNNPIINKILN